jgi:hypothetical protein
MSRVVYSNTPATAAQEALRVSHGVRLVTDAEEGTGVHLLPPGVYGFTYSPGLPGAPLFATRRYRSFEIHKVADGEVFVVGFVAAEGVRALESSLMEVTIQVQPEPEGEASILAKIPYSRIQQHRQHAVPNQHGFAVTVRPLTTPV